MALGFPAKVLKRLPCRFGFTTRLAHMQLVRRVLA
jgi:hypothetical protein